MDRKRGTWVEMHYNSEIKGRHTQLPGLALSYSNTLSYPWPYLLVLAVLGPRYSSVSEPLSNDFISCSSSFLKPFFDILADRLPSFQLRCFIKIQSVDGNEDNGEACLKLFCHDVI